MIPTEPTKKKDTIRISKKDLLKLLADNEHLTQQVKDLQGRCNEYLEEVRSLKKDLEEAEKALEETETVPELEEDKIKKVMEEIAKNPPKPPVRPSNPMPRHPFGRDIYIDGASRFGR